MNRRKLKKAAKWLMRKYDSIGGSIELDRSIELVQGAMYNWHYHAPISFETYQRAAWCVWQEEYEEQYETYQS